MNNLFTERIELVSSTFRKGAELATELQELSSLLKELDRTERGFRAVVYEGAAMQLASTDLEDQDLKMPLWSALLENAKQYNTHLHIGLGWALAKMELPFKDLSIDLSPFDKDKALDGAGYFAGLFQRRVVIRAQQIPSGISNDQLVAFDQGIGRSIWYITKGDIEHVHNVISHFPEERRTSLWTGIGLASTFVGGYQTDDLKGLEMRAEKYAINLKCGVVLAIRGRYVTGSLDEYAEIAAMTYFDLSPTAVAESLFPDKALNNKDLIKGIQALFRSSLTTS